MITYHELREILPEKARELVRKVLAKQGGDVSKTARIMNISRPTVRRAGDGALEDQSRRPLHSPTKTASHFERLIVQEAKRTEFRYRRLTGYLQRKVSHRFPEDTVKAVLRRNGVKKKTRRPIPADDLCTNTNRLCRFRKCSWTQNTCWIRMHCRPRSMHI